MLIDVKEPLATVEPHSVTSRGGKSLQKEKKWAGVNPTHAGMPKNRHLSPKITIPWNVC
jgi:hypothetical protein